MAPPVPAGFDYWKFGASIIALVVAVLGIAFKYKLVSRSDDPAQPETEKLSLLGWGAMLLVLLGGGFSIYSDVKSQQAKDTATQQALRELARSHQAQEKLNRTTDSLVAELRAALAQARSGNAATGAARAGKRPRVRPAAP